MSCHEGVTCDNCLITGFSGQRLKCLNCFDYDLCQECYAAGAYSNNHLPSHSMQCILTRSHIDILLGGEAGALLQQSFQCPFCPLLGFTTHSLETHVRNKHKDKTSIEVICPVCSVTPNSEPNRVTTDLPQHIISTHKKPVLDMYEEEIGLAGGVGGFRQIRRVNNSSRGAISSQRMRTNLQSINFGEQNKESLSMIRGTRGAPGISSHLQQLESQLTTTRQQLERLRTLNVDFSMREALFNQLPRPSSKPAKMAVLNGVIINDSGASLSSGFSDGQHFTTESPPNNTAFNTQISSSNQTKNNDQSTLSVSSQNFLLNDFDFLTHASSNDVEDGEASALSGFSKSLFAQEIIMSVMTSKELTKSLSSFSIYSHVSLSQSHEGNEKKVLSPPHSSASVTKGANSSSNTTPKPPQNNLIKVSLSSTSSAVSPTPRVATCVTIKKTSSTTSKNNITTSQQISSNNNTAS